MHGKQQCIRKLLEEWEPVVTEIETYNILPHYPLAEGHLLVGFAALGQWILHSGATLWTIDGMSGIDWAVILVGLQQELAGYQVAYINIDKARLDSAIVTKQRSSPKLISTWMPPSQRCPY